MYQCLDFLAPSFEKDFMKKFCFIVALIFSTVIQAEENCKTLRACAEWATGKTGVKYDLGKLEKRSLRMEKDFNVNEGDADFLFNYILQTNDMVRLKRENAQYQVINSRDMKDFQFPALKPEEIPATLDFYTVDFPMTNKERVTNARIVLKKHIGKHGRMLEVSDSPKLQIVETGVQLNAIKVMINELNK